MRSWRQSRVLAMMVGIVLIISTPPALYAQINALTRFGWSMLTASEAPDTPIRSVKDERVRFRDLLTPGPPLTIVNFWATWCKPCVEEIPDLQRLHTTLGNRGLRVILVNTQEPLKGTQLFLRRLGITLPSYFDTRGRLATQFGVRGMPVSFLINERGQVIARYVGLFPWTNDGFIELLTNLL